MKKLLLPFLVLFILSACNKEMEITPAAISTTERTTSDQVTDYDFSQLPSSVSSYFIQTIDSDLIANERRYKPSIGQMSSEPIYVADESIPTEELAGHCRFLRTEHGVHISWRTTGLNPGQSYEIYAAVVNHDAACMPLLFPVFQAFDVIALGEQEANPTGRLNLNAYVLNGDGSISWPAPDGSGVGVVEAAYSNIIVFARASGTTKDVRICESIVCE